MQASFPVSGHFLDILFHQRNKQYGAYELRVHYPARALRALGITCLLPLILAIVVYLTFQNTPHLPLALPTTEPALTKLTEIVLPTHPPQITLPPPTTSSHTDPGLYTIVPASNIPDLPTVAVTNPGPPAIDVPVTGSPLTGSPALATTGPAVSFPATILQPEKIYDDADVQVPPEFPGGEDALMNYLGAQIHYPEQAIHAEASGRVVVGFIVNAKGEIEGVKILRGIGHGCDEEAMRVVAAMPRWKPANNNGHAVPVYFNIPVVFEIHP